MKTSQRISARTVLAFGFAESPVVTFKTTAEEKPPSFTTAGPHGKPLQRAPVKDGKRLAGGVPVQTAEAQVVESPSDYERPGGPLDVTDLPLPEVEEGVINPEPVYVGVLEEGYDEEVPEEAVRRGVRIGDSKQFVDLTDLLVQVDETTKLERMEVIGFVRRETVPRQFVRDSYYLAADPEGGNAKVPRLLLEAMKGTGRVAVVKWTKTKNQALGVVVYGRSNELVLLELAWSAEWRKPGPRALTHTEAEVDAEEVAAAIELAEAMGDSPELIAEQENDRVRLLKELVKRAEDGTLPDFQVPVPAVLAEEPKSMADLLRAGIA